MEPRIISRTIDLAVEYQTQQQGWGKRLMLTGSSGADRLVLTIVNNRTPETLTGLNALAYFETLDGDVMKKGQISGHIVSIDFPDEAYAYKDQITVKVYLSDGKRNIPINVEKFDIGQGYGETLIDPDDMIPNMSALVAMLEEIKANKEAYDKAAQRAEDAAAAAVAATADASKAASSANAAAASASGAAAEASSAAGSANAAAGTANASASAADHAAAEASAAIESANAAADRANSAAANVDAEVDAAVNAAQAAQQAAAETQLAMDECMNEINTLKQVDNTKVDNAEVTPDGELYLLCNGERVAGPFSGFGGGTGSGGSSNNAVLTVKNACDWLSKSIASGESCTVAATWNSLEDGLETGMGNLTVTVGGVVRMSKSVNQGLVSADVKEWLSTGSNLVRLSLADSYGNSRSINYTVTVVAISLTSSFDPSGTFGSAIPFTYIPVGAVSKTVHFEVDGTEIGTATVVVSGRQQSYNIPAQNHGAHSLRVWFEADINGQTVPSNELYYDLICIEDGNTTPIIASTFRAETAVQFDPIIIPYRVYDPATLTAAISLIADGETVAELTVDRTEQTWTRVANGVGALELAIKCGDVQRTFSLTVTESIIDVEAETNDLSLYLTSYGRSNGEAEPGKWEYGDVAASFTGFNWKSDGWLKDSGNNTVLRVTGDARVNVPFEIFKNDFRSTGKTIEVEFGTRDVLDYDAMILSSMSDGRGISITAQRADMASEQSTIGTQYKEEEHVRLTFVTEKRSGNRLILIYLNGIISGIKQYPDSDDFSQGSPVGLSIGSNDCTIDLYNIRVYDNDLTRYQVLDNWIADTQDGAEKMARYERNQIYNDYGDVVPEQLPKALPYMVLVGPALPTIKGNKVTISGYYVDPLHPENSFTFADAEADVQGTSSKDYYVKNFKIKFKGGFDIDGTNVEAYALRGDDLPANVFTFKADVASSEGANNVELVRLYNDISPHKTPPQLVDSRVRQGIDGLPCVIFWDNGTEVAFQGKYNFNHDKSSDVFGFADGDECWEIKNNVSNRVLFKSADFSDSSEETGWLNDFEGRYPDGNTDPTDLAAFVAWVVSTDREAATGAALSPSVTYEGVTYTSDTADYRLAKFKHELSSHANVTSAQFYWLFTEIFLMVDSRAKNAFPTKFHGDDKWCWLPYDMDTAIGINNEGALVFDYALEDTDLTEAGELVFNGQESVFWKNVRDAFQDEIKAMYADLRTSGKLTYENVMERFATHQDVWPEAIFNEDAFRKYIEPYEVEGATIYFAMAQGKKELQRTWWLFNRFRYFDAKYDTGTIAQDRILIRIYADADIAITPYADTYLRSKYGSYSYQIRAKRDKEYLLHCYVDAANDLETTLFPASLIAEIADLAPLHIGLADFSRATKLQVLKIGDSAEDYSNGNLTELTLGNNTLLHQLDVRNCPNLTTSVDLSGCTNIEHVWFTGTGIKGLALPNGGILKTMHLPDTVTNLTLLNQKAITDFVLGSYSQITTLRLENVAEIIPSAEILAAIPVNSRVRLIGFDWTMDDADAVFALHDRLDTMRGLDENDGNMDKAQVSGTIHIDSLTGAELAEMQSRYPYITIQYNHITSYLYFYDDAGSTLLAMAEVQDGGNGAYEGSTPTKASTAQYTYTFSGWSLTPGGSANANALNNVTADRNVYAAFTATVRTYTVRWYNGSTLLETDTGVPYGGSAEYNGEAPEYSGENAEDYEFTGFAPSGKNITGDTNCYAQFQYSGYLYPQVIDGTVTTYASDTLTTVGEYAFYSATSLTKAELAAVTSIGAYAFTGCTALNMLILRNAEMVTLGTSALASSAIASGTGYVYVPAALVDTYKADSAWSVYAAQIRVIEDYPETFAKASWEMVNYRIEQGDYASYYAVGDLIPLDLGTEGLVNMQIAGFDMDELADDSGMAHISFISKELLATSHRMNPELVTNDDGTYQEGTGTIGGWEKCELRTYLQETIKPLIPKDVSAMIQTVAKTQTSYNTAGTSETQATEDDVWIPSEDEVSGKTSKYNALFQNTNTTKIKKKAGSSGATVWWLRNANASNNKQIRSVNSSGAINNSYAYYNNSVALCFCV